MAGTTAWILGDQLSADNRALEGADRALLVQSDAALRTKRFHRQKLHLVLVAMGTFADELRERGLEVEIVQSPTICSSPIPTRSRAGRTASPAGDGGLLPPPAPAP